MRVFVAHVTQPLGMRGEISVPVRGGVVVDGSDFVERPHDGVGRRPFRTEKIRRGRLLIRDGLQEEGDHLVRRASGPPKTCTPARLTRRFTPRSGTRRCCFGCSLSVLVLSVNPVRAVARGHGWWCGSGARG